MLLGSNVARSGTGGRDLLHPAAHRAVGEAGHDLLPLGQTAGTAHQAAVGRQRQAVAPLELAVHVVGGQQPAPRLHALVLAPEVAHG